MSARPPSVVLAAGGTAGHVEPALNLADELIALDPQTRITVIGGDRGLETTLVPARGYPLLSVPAAPMPRRPQLICYWFGQGSVLLRNERKSSYGK